MVEASSDEWCNVFGGAGGDLAYSMVETVDGDFVLLGYTNSFGAGNNDFWLIKIDHNGNTVWNRTYGGPSFDQAYSLIITSDGGFALAGITDSFDADSDFWLIKTDTEGNMQWNQTYEAGAYDCAYSLIEASDGGYVLAGHSSFILQNSWVIKTDPTGIMQWNKTYGQGEIQCLIETSDGGFAFVLGSQLFKIDVSGNVKWNQEYDGTVYSLIEMPDGGYAMAGITNSAGAGLADFWLSRTDSYGNLTWSRTYGGSYDDIAYSLVATSDEGFALAGKTHSFDVGQGDFWLVKTDASGNQEWNQTYGGEGIDIVRSLVEVSAGGFALAGTTNSLGAGDNDFCFVKTDSYGIIPEFPVSTIIPLLSIASFVAILCKRKLMKKRSIL